MKKINLICTLLFFFVTHAQEQTDSLTVKTDSIPKYWTGTNKFGLNISEVAFINWNAGGQNSISAIASAAFSRKYKKENIIWNNELLLNYGLNAQEGQEVRKTDDVIALNSTFGFRKDSLSNWYYSAKLSFNTQFSDGYDYPDTSTPISRFMSPAYLFFGVGTEYTAKKTDFTVYMSPLTLKSTFVFDQDLANIGAFGVERAVYDGVGTLIREGKNVRTELGFLLSSVLKKELYKNMNLSNRISFYGDYLNDFGNVDVDWEINLDLIVNKYVKANIGTHLKYDNDVKADEYTALTGETVAFSPKVQFKVILGVGILYTF